MILEKVVFTNKKNTDIFGKKQDAVTKTISRAQKARSRGKGNRRATPKKRAGKRKKES